jgi:hypothetical protein
MRLHLCGVAGLASLMAFARNETAPEHLPAVTKLLRLTLPDSGFETAGAEDARAKQGRDGEAN